MLIIGIVILCLHLIVGFIVGGNRLVANKSEQNKLDYNNFEKNQPKPIVRYLDDQNND